MNVRKIKEIIQAYSIMLRPNEEQNKIAIERLEICDGCDKRKVNSVGIPYCGECGCVIRAKIFAKSNSCPLKKWKR